MEAAKTLFELLEVLVPYVEFMTAIVRLVTALIERRKKVVLRCCCSCLTFRHAPRIVCPGQCSHRRRADAVAAHMHLLGFGEGLAVGAVADDVVAQESMSLVEPSWLQHP